MLVQITNTVAPEVFKTAFGKTRGYSYAVDWWGLGVSIFEIMRGKVSCCCFDSFVTFRVSFSCTSEYWNIFYNVIIFHTFTETLPYKFKHKFVPCNSNVWINMLNLPIVMVEELYKSFKSGTISQPPLFSLYDYAIALYYYTNVWWYAILLHCHYHYSNSYTVTPYIECYSYHDCIISLLKFHIKFLNGNLIS